jgi:hypothetical protein
MCVWRWPHARLKKACPSSTHADLALSPSMSAQKLRRLLASACASVGIDGYGCCFPSVWQSRVPCGSLSCHPAVYVEGHTLHPHLSTQMHWLPNFGRPMGRTVGGCAFDARVRSDHFEHGMPS